jgi:AraC-like DNA-binding protein
MSAGSFRRRGGRESEWSMYREFQPPRALARFVECFWTRRLDDPADDRAGTILPDGRVDLIWLSDGGTLVAGPATRALPRPIAAPFSVVGARLRIGAVPSVIVQPAHELIDSHVPLEALDGRAVRELAARLEQAGDPATAARAMADGIAALTRRDEGGDLQVRGAVRALGRAGATVAGAAADAGLSERQLRRRFRDAVGYGPKTLQRVLRFQSALARLRDEPTPGGGIARAAAEAGYADQAHLTRETRELAGLTPSELAAIATRA